MVNGLIDMSEGKTVEKTTATIVVVGKDEVQKYLDQGYS